MKKIFTFAIFISCLLCSIPSQAQRTMASDGISWLTASQNTDGSWGSQSDLAIVYSADVLGALQYLDSNGINYSQGISWLSSQDVTCADELSRKIVALTNAGQDVFWLSVNWTFSRFELNF